MGSQQFAESLQLEDAMDSSWTVAAYEAVQVWPAACIRQALRIVPSTAKKAFVMNQRFSHANI